jgi:hypothetical protein
MFRSFMVFCCFFLGILGYFFTKFGPWAYFSFLFVTVLVPYLLLVSKIYRLAEDQGTLLNYYVHRISIIEIVISIILLFIVWLYSG